MFFALAENVKFIPPFKKPSHASPKKTFGVSLFWTSETAFEDRAETHNGRGFLTRNSFSHTISSISVVHIFWKRPRLGERRLSTTSSYYSFLKFYLQSIHFEGRGFSTATAFCLSKTGPVYVAIAKVKKTSVRINDGVNQSLFRMRRAFYFSFKWRQFECVCGLYNEFRWTADKEVSVMSFPGNSCIKLPITEGWKKRPGSEPNREPRDSGWTR